MIEELMRKQHLSFSEVKEEANIIQKQLYVEGEKNMLGPKKWSYQITMDFQKKYGFHPESVDQRAGYIAGLYFQHQKYNMNKENKFTLTIGDIPVIYGQIEKKEVSLPLSDSTKTIMQLTISDTHAGTKESFDICDEKDLNYYTLQASLERAMTPYWKELDMMYQNFEDTYTKDESPTVLPSYEVEEVTDELERD